jgi:hypothetical protein
MQAIQLALQDIRCHHLTNDVLVYHGLLKLRYSFLFQSPGSGTDFTDPAANPGAAERPEGA